MKHCTKSKKYFNSLDSCKWFQMPWQRCFPNTFQILYISIKFREKESLKTNKQKKLEGKFYFTRNSHSITNPRNWKYPVLVSILKEERQIFLCHYTQEQSQSRQVFFTLIFSTSSEGHTYIKNIQIRFQYQAEAL